MEERARGSRKFLGFSATRRKELSVGHNGQAVISFTRRIPRPSVLQEDKKNVGCLFLAFGRRKNIAASASSADFQSRAMLEMETPSSRWLQLRMQLNFFFFFLQREKFVMKNLIRRENGRELFATKYFCYAGKIFYLLLHISVFSPLFDISCLKMFSPRILYYLRIVRVCFIFESLMRNLMQMYRRQSKFL